MGYVLGIDLGDTRTRAAVARGGEQQVVDAEIVALDAYDSENALDQDRDGSISTVLHLGPDGAVLVGREAEAMSEHDPQRVVRGFTSRAGDSAPVVLPEGPYPAEVLAATLAGWVADEVAAIEGSGPERVAVTHPPDWGTHRRGALHAALDEAGLPGVLLIPNAVAAAYAHARREHVGVDAVLGFGGIGRLHLDAALLRATESGFELLAPAGRPPSQPGARIDDLLLRHILGKAGHEKPEAVELPGRVHTRLRGECERAKRMLSTEPRAVVPVPGPGRGDTTQIELDTEEFEHLAKPVVRTALGAVRHSAGTVGTGELAAVLLAGGTARIPLMRELASTTLGDKLALEQDPGTTVCRGAALAARGRPDQRDSPGVTADPAPAGTSTALVGYGSRAHGVTAYADDPAGPAPGRPPIEITTLERPKSRGRRLGRLAGRSRKAQEEP